MALGTDPAVLVRIGIGIVPDGVVERMAVVAASVAVVHWCSRIVVIAMLAPRPALAIIITTVSRGGGVKGQRRP